ncbi:MAG: SpoIID/LytB domain-containing protein [Microgenomates group bacterium]
MGDFFYQKKIVDEDRKTIIKIVLYIKNLEETKKKLEQEKNQLSYLKQEIDKQSQILGQQIIETRQKIAQLSALQQELIAKKFAANPIPRSAGTSLGGCSPDYDPINNQVKKDPGFSPKFGFFSIGAPNKTGMNQYGAYGRAKAGQNYRDILSSYYNNIRFECRNFKDNKIKVQNYGELNIKDYLKGLSEMHRDRTDVYEAFKAQIVAASSYAYAYTNGGEREICSTESCQVYRGKDDHFVLWNQAVDEVNSECGDGALVMVSNDTNEVITAWYSSTHGGVMLKSGEIGWSDKPWTKHGFDAASSINSLRDLLMNAYDGPNHANSPWFYCNWGYRSEYNNTAWLKESEVLEIVNALILFKLDNSTLSHLSQLDKNIPDTWDENRVRQEIKNRGGQYFSSISSIEVVWDGTGISHTMIIKGDIGEKQFNAQEFKDIFNVRARGNLIIVPSCLITSSDQVGRCKNYALFDVIVK